VRSVAGVVGVVVLWCGVAEYSVCSGCRGVVGVVVWCLTVLWSVVGVQTSGEQEQLLGGANSSSDPIPD
jgi:hypothetical protein